MSFKGSFKNMKKKLHRYEQKENLIKIYAAKLKWFSSEWNIWNLGLSWSNNFPVIRL